MNFIKNAKGFTLIELLVVITIIGILATGATATYTSQIQKARDTTRINDVKALQSAIEQFYQDSNQYPNHTSDDFGSGGVLKYMPKLPKDPKNGQPCAQNGGTQPQCNYVYKVSQDDNSLDNGAYEISTAFENKGNIDSKAKLDKLGGGNNDDNRLEIGIPTNTGVDTKLDTDAACKGLSGILKTTSNKCVNTAVNSTADNTTPIVIAGS